MIRQFLMDRLGTPDPSAFLLLLGAGLTLILAGMIWLLRSSGEPESRFRVREADRMRRVPKAASGSESKLAEARMRPFEGVLRLEGIRIDGRPHEVLGISASATPQQVQKAYRELMKRFHPDRVGRPGSREWADAQKIAEAINRAKEALLKNQ